MKKLIAILVVFAMVTGVAFAQATVSGALEYHWTVAGGQTVNDVEADPSTTVLTGESYIQLAISNEEGTAGGLLRYMLIGLNNQSWEVGPMYAAHNRAFMWWRPIPQLELYLGKDGDGKFGTDGNVRWGFHRGNRGVVMGGEYWAASDTFIGGWDAFGFAMSIFPIDGLFLHLALSLPTDPFDRTASASARSYLVEDYAEKIQVQVGYAADFGRFRLTWQGEQMGDRIGFTFDSGSLVEGLNLEAAFSYGLTSEVMNIGLGAVYDAGGWGVKGRFFFLNLDDMNMMINVMPYFDLSILQAFINLRFDIPADDGDMTILINPYVVKNVGPLQMRAGFNFQIRGDDSWWSLPIGAVISF